MIERRARSGFTEVGTTPTYRRKYINRTGITIVIVDGNGTIEYVEPERAALNDPTRGRFTIVEEYTEADHSRLVECGIPYEDIDAMQHRNGGIVYGFHIRHAYSYELLAESDGGIYDECLGLFIALSTDVDQVKHPRFSQEMRVRMDERHTLGIMVEILDPRRVWPNMFVKLGGIVYVIKPTRDPTPAQEGVLITLRDSVTGKLEQHLHSVEELIEGGGKYGIRLYRNRFDAKEDNRDPDRAELEAMRRAFIEERDKHDKKVKEAAKAEAYREKEQEFEKERKAYKEKFRKFEEESDKRHREKMKDKSTFFTYFMKGVMAVVDFMRWCVTVVC